MMDAALWLIRWLLIGSAAAGIVVAIAWIMEQRSQHAALWVMRAVLLLCVATPLIALTPPLLLVPREVVEATPLAIVVEPDLLIEPALDAAPLATTQALQIDWLAIAGILALTIWASGAALLIAARVRAHEVLRRTFRAGAPYSTPDGVPPCRLSSEVDGVIVFDALNPRILAPADFPAWPSQEREFTLRHETAHVARGDLFWAVIADFARAIFWCSPPVHALAARHMTATEAACDASALSGGGDAHDYAAALVKLARRMRHQGAGALAMARPAGIKHRVERLIGASRPAAASDAAAFVATFVCGAVLLIGAAPAVAQYSANAAGECACNDRPPFIPAWPMAELSRRTLNDQAALIRLVQNGERAEQTAAARALGDWTTDAAHNALVAALASPDAAVRAEAVRSLAKRRDVARVTAALDDASCEVRAVAATSMERLRPAGAQSRLVALTRDDACIVRQGAHAGLAGYQSRASAAALRVGLEDPDQRVRSQAASSLSEVGDGDALDGLQAQLTRDLDKHVRQAAADALGRIAPRGDDATVRSLIGALADDNEHVRYAAVVALGRVGDDRAETGLRALLTDPNDVVRDAAAEALDDIGDARQTGTPSL